mgnify:CR=1 FL=1
MQLKISRMGATVMKNEDDVIGNEITGGGSSSSGPLKSLLEVCPICGKEIFPAIKPIMSIRHWPDAGGSITAAITALNSGRIPKN